MAAKRRQYSDNDKAAALAALDANNGNVYKTARQLGIGRTTLENWARGRGVNHDVPELRRVKKTELADTLEQVAETYAAHLLEPTTIMKTSAKDAAITVGTAIDKMRLLRGLPTEIVAVIPLLVQALQDNGLDASDVFNAMLARLHAHSKQSA